MPLVAAVAFVVVVAVVVVDPFQLLLSFVRTNTVEKLFEPLRNNLDWFEGTFQPSDDIKSFSNKTISLKKLQKMSVGCNSDALKFPNITNLGTLGHVRGLRGQARVVSGDGELRNFDKVCILLPFYGFV